MTHGLVLQPWADHAEVLGFADEGLEVEVYDGGTEPAGEVLDRVTFYVPPYMGPERTLELLARMPRLRVVQTLTAGVDNVWPFLPDGVTLCNAAGVHDASTAELAVGLILASLRRIDEFARAQATGEWRHDRFDALADKRVLVVGAGRVARALVRRLEPFEVEITVVGRTRRETHDGSVVHGSDELPELLPGHDVVVLIVPQTVETTGLVDAAFLARMRRGALLVNVARGGVVVTDDLLAAVRRGHVRAALDVTDPEPLPVDHPLWTAPGVLISPHVGGDTTAFLPRAHLLVAQQLRRWRLGEPLENVMARPGDETRGTP
ncbi:MAG TPA: 2-hydroxyacid dehydrogenase [Candidatus Angelobacter sp.]|nr:2-hydroxyacid dehydrogenase [Candidatus Angelobacter sp.]